MPGWLRPVMLAPLVLGLLLSPVVQGESWEYGAEVYVWGAGIGATTVSGDDIDISFSDLISNLDMTFMGTFAARKGDLGLFADFIYLDVSDEDKTTAQIIHRPVKLDVDVEMKSFIATLGAAYRIAQTDSSELELLAGARYLDLEADLGFQIGAGVKHKVSDSDDVWDAIAGLRARTELSPEWYLTFYTDAGRGESDLTWQVLTGINYRFDDIDAVFGYRYLKWEFDDGEVFDDLDISGPYLGVKYFF